MTIKVKKYKLKESVQNVLGIGLLYAVIFIGTFLVCKGI